MKWRKAGISFFTRYKSYFSCIWFNGWFTCCYGVIISIVPLDFEVEEQQQLYRYDVNTTMGVFFGTNMKTTAIYIGK